MTNADVAPTENSTSSTYLPPGVPGPARARGGLDDPFWDATKRHELVIQRCNQCRTWQMGPEWICHKCHTLDMGWEQVEPKGIIYSWERCWHHVHKALKGFGPYLAIIVELPHAGGVRLIGNLLGDPMQEVQIGAEVVGVFEDHEEGETLLQWRLADS